jgi:hypothetical protein
MHAKAGGRGCLAPVDDPFLHPEIGFICEPLDVFLMIE